MAIRSTLLPAAMLALPLLVNACGTEPTSAPTRTQALEARFLAGDPVLKLIPTAGNFAPPDFAKETGNGLYSQARWTNKVALDKFSVLLQKSVDYASCYTSTPENGCAAFAAVIVSGGEGITISDLSTIGFFVNCTSGAGSPRRQPYYYTKGAGPTP